MFRQDLTDAQFSELLPETHRQFEHPTMLR